MKLSTSIINNPEGKTIPRKKKFRFEPVIGLERSVTYGTGDPKHAEQITCYNEPNAAESMTYKVPVPYFSDGQPEDVLDYFTTLQKVLDGQGWGNDNAGAVQKYALVKRTLEGEAKDQWIKIVADLVPLDQNGKVLMTTDLHARCVNDFKTYYFPRDAGMKMKRALRRTLRKPANVTTRQYVARFELLNQQLACYPQDVNGNDIVPLDELERKECYHFHIPSSWSAAMAQQGWNPVSHAIKEIVDFCEERVEEFEQGEWQNSKSASKKSSDSTKKRKVKLENNQGEKGGGKKQKFCLHHGRNSTHATNECNFIKKKLNLEQEGSSKFKSNGKKKSYSEEEVHAIAEAATAKAVKSLVKDMKKKRKHEEDMQINELVDLCSETTLSDNDSSSSSDE